MTDPNQQSEIAELKAALNALTAHMDESLPEERVKKLVENAASEDRRGRRRLQILIVGLLAIAIIVGMAGAFQSHSNGQTLKEAKVTADYVRNCLQTPAAKRDPKKCMVDDSSKVIKGLVDFIKCSQLIIPEQRTEAKLDACAARAFGG